MALHLPRPTPRPSTRTLACLVALTVVCTSFTVGCGGGRDADPAASSRPTSAASSTPTSESDQPATTVPDTSTPATTPGGSAPDNSTADGPRTTASLGALRSELDDAGRSLDAADTANREAGDALAHDQEGTIP